MSARQFPPQSIPFRQTADFSCAPKQAGRGVIGQARQGGGRRWLLQGWQCAGGAVGRGGLLYAGIGQAGSAGMVCSRPGGGVLPGAGSLRRALAGAGGAV